MDDRTYYHALYHLVTHWAGFYATVGLLMSFLVLLSTTRELDRLGARICWVATLVIVLGSWFFLLRLSFYAHIAARGLPTSYVKELTEHYAFNPPLWLGAFGTLAAGLTICWLAAKRSYPSK